MHVVIERLQTIVCRDICLRLSHVDVVYALIDELWGGDLLLHLLVGYESSPGELIRLKLIHRRMIIKFTYLDFEMIKLPY